MAPNDNQHGSQTIPEGDAPRHPLDPLDPEDPKSVARRLWFGRYPGGQTVAALAIALFATAALSIGPAENGWYMSVDRVDPTATGWLYVFYEVLLSFPGHAESIPLLALACLLTFPVRYVFFGRRDSWRPSVCLPAAFFSLCMVFGRSYDLTDGAHVILGAAASVIEGVIAAAGWFVMAQVGIYLLYECLDWFGARRIAFSESRYGRLWAALDLILDRRPFVGPLLAIAVAWSPTFIAGMPGIFMGDTGAQIREWFNIPNGTSDYLNLIDPNVLLNAHHPVAHTALLGGCVQLGMALFGDENAGMLIYTALQFSLTVAAIAYSLSVLRRLGAGLVARACALGFFAFMPMFPNYAVLATKDVLFGDAVLLLAVEMARFLAAGRRAAGANAGEEATRRVVVPGTTAPALWGRADAARLLVAALGCTFLRNGGLVFPLVVCALMAAFAWFDARRAASARRADPAAKGESAAAPSAPRLARRAIPVLAVLALTVAANLAFNQVVMPALHITPGSRREALSIPFQQTARFVQKHDGAHSGVEGGTDDGLVTPNEREVIDRVLRYDDLGSRYDPDKSDSVKNSFNEDATDEDMAAYFKVWAEMFWKDPESYISAIANNYYGYFYPSERDVWVYSVPESTKIMERPENRAYFYFHHSDAPLNAFFGHTVSLYRVAVQRLPLLSLTMSSSAYVWILILATCYLLRARQWRGLALMVPLLGVLAVCLIGPCNGSTYMRYLYPAIVSLPFALIAALAWPRPLWGSGRRGGV